MTITPENFVYWLQGFVEMNPNAMLTHTQWEILKDHLKLVMDKKTPQKPFAPIPGIIPPVIAPPPPPAVKYPSHLDQVYPYTVTC